MWSNLQCTCVQCVSLTFMFVVHRYKSSVTKLPLYIAYIHTMSILWHAREHGIRPGTFCRKHTFCAIQLPGSGTRYNAYLQYQDTYYDVTHVYVKYTQKFRANRPILMTRVAVAFIFSSFWLKFFVQHSVFAREGEMRRFFSHRTCYEVLRVSLTNLALPCPGPSLFFNNLLLM